MGYFAVLLVLALWAIFPLSQRWREERQDHRVALSVEWSEVRDLFARRGDSDSEILAAIKQAGASTVVLAPTTLADLVLHGRIEPLGFAKGLSPLDVSRLQIRDSVLAAQVLQQWQWRGVQGVNALRQGNSVIVSRAQGHFSALQDIDVGFDPQLVDVVRTAGLAPVFRLYEDAWLAPDQLSAWMNALPRGFVQSGVLFSSEGLPGGLDAKPLWRSWLQERQTLTILPEFHPTAAARIMARAWPAQTFRVHSIPASEMNNLTPEKMQARWKRAVLERSVRMLLVRVGANESISSLMAEVTELAQMIRRGHLDVSFPQPRVPAKNITRFQLLLSPWLALIVVCLTPGFALGWLRPKLLQPKQVFWGVVLLSLAGALATAAIADNPYTRLAITPFRGVKLGFLVSWALAVLVLYEGAELRFILKRTVTRQDLFVGAIAAAVLGYLLLRSGNASSGWKPAWEQSARDGLEALLVARPRFKEWALGYPLLWAGCSLQALYLQRRISLDARPLICLGMIGPISMMNTFCHLHSPLWIELLRSLNGCVLGVFGGMILFRVISFFLPKSPSAKASWRGSEPAMASSRGGL